MPFQIACLYDTILKGMPFQMPFQKTWIIWKGMLFDIISYKKSIWKGIKVHLKGIVQKLEDSQIYLLEHTFNFVNLDRASK